MAVERWDGWRGDHAEGKIRIEAKDDLKARIGRSPDRADAVVMAVAGEARKRLRRGGIATA
jgi:hypothetical protein